PEASLAKLAANDVQVVPTAKAKGLQEKGPGSVLGGLPAPSTEVGGEASVLRGPSRKPSEVAVTGPVPPLPSAAPPGAPPPLPAATASAGTTAGTTMPGGPPPTSTRFPRTGDVQL